MKNLCLALLLSVLTFSSCTNNTPIDRIIKTTVPERSVGQKDVLQLTSEPMEKVRVAVIGLGMRGPGAVARMSHIPGAEIVALCDIDEAKVKKANKILTDKGLPIAKEYYGSEDIWRQVTALPDVDLVYVATDWVNHAKMGVQAMKDGKHVAIEVPAAMTLDEIWDLINTSEQTRKHCMQLENCVYDFFELTTLSMVQQGLLGEILHGEGAYIHGLQPFWDDYWNNWRMDYNQKHRGDVYPTHGIGPVCQAMNIHRGNKMNYLVSVDTKAVGNPAFLKEKRGQEVKDFKNGDHTTTSIVTENGGNIIIQHNITSPRPYDRKYLMTGTKGYAAKYPVQGYAIATENLDPELTKNHENLTTHSFVPAEVKKELMKKYKHYIVNDELEEKAKQVGGHGGMDFIMDYRLIYCLQNGLPLDMDVYDLAEWCSLIPLTAISLENSSSPVEIPDFTRGGWKKIDGLKFSMKK